MHALWCVRGGANQPTDQLTALTLSLCSRKYRPLKRGGSSGLLGCCSHVVVGVSPWSVAFNSSQQPSTEPSHSLHGIVLFRNSPVKNPCESHKLVLCYESQVRGIANSAFCICVCIRVLVVCVEHTYLLSHTTSLAPLKAQLPKAEVVAREGFIS